MAMPFLRLPAGVLLRFLISLALALVLWGWVTTQQDPPLSRRFANLPLQSPSLPENLQIVTELPSITIRAEGPRSLIEDLDEAELSPRLDLDGVDGPNSYTVPVEVAAPNGIEIEQVSPRQVTLVIDETVGLAFPLEPRQVPPRDSARRIGEVEPAVSDVTVSGPKSSVDRVERVELEVDIGARAADFTVTLAPVALDAAGERVTGVEIVPAQVETAVEVVAQGKSVPVLIQTVGVPDEGYEEVDRVVDPDEVVLDGPAATLDGILSVSTDPVPIGGVRQPVVRSVGIADLPPEVRVVEPADGAIVVVVQIRARGTTQTLDEVPVTVTDLAPGLAAEVEPRVLDVEIYAADATLAALEPGDIVPRVSAAGLGTGTYELPIQVTVPPGGQWTGNGPTTVRVTIGAADAAAGATPAVTAGAG